MKHGPRKIYHSAKRTERQFGHDLETTHNSQERFENDREKTRTRDRHTNEFNVDFYTTTTIRAIPSESSHKSSNYFKDPNMNDMNAYTYNNERQNNEDLENSYAGRRNSNLEESRTYDSRRTDRYQTTQRNFYTRPGVKPIRIDNRPPITNSPRTTHTNFWTTERTTRRIWSTNPVTQSPIWTTDQKWTTKRPDERITSNRRTQKPTSDSVITFPDNQDVVPEFSLGPDVDNYSQTEKRRLIEQAERMCNQYKSVNTKQVQAIPLIPSPEPVEVNVSACTPTTIPLVVGGKVVSIKQFPHMALLGWKNLDQDGYSWKCGGSLISDQFVLTAAHCAYQERDNTVTTGPPRAVQLGSSFLGDSRAKVIKVSSVVKHPKYKVPKSYNDLAVVKLVSKVVFSEFIKPACLGLPPNEGQHIIATGWGRTEFGGDQSLDLRSVSLPVWSIEECSEVLGVSRKLPDGPSRESQMCAGERSGGKDTCQGDSGGPAQVQDGCVWRVVAVTSLGRSCGAIQTPGLYATVQIPFVSAIVFKGQSNRNNSSFNSEPSNTYRPTSNDRRPVNNYQSPVNNYQNPVNNHQNPVNTPAYNNIRPTNNIHRPVNGRPDTNYRPQTGYRPAENGVWSNNDYNPQNDEYRPLNYNFKQEINQYTTKNVYETNQNSEQFNNNPKKESSYNRYTTNLAQSQQNRKNDMNNNYYGFNNKRNKNINSGYEIVDSEEPPLWT